MDIVYDGGANITAENIYPKETPFASKTFTVTGNSTTDLDMEYYLTLQVTTNTFSANALKYRLTSTNTGDNGEVAPSKLTDQNISTGEDAIYLGAGTFTSPTNGGKVHTYTLSLYFPDTWVNQNVDKGKAFTAYVKIGDHPPGFTPEVTE